MGRTHHEPLSIPCTYCILSTVLGYTPSAAVFVRLLLKKHNCEAWAIAAINNVLVRVATDFPMHLRKFGLTFVAILATAEVQLDSQPVDAQVSVFAAIGLNGSDVVNFPHHPLPDSIQGSLLAVVRVKQEQNQCLFGEEIGFGVFSVAYSPDGKQIVSGSADETVRRWNAATGLPIGLPTTPIGD